MRTIARHSLDKPSRNGPARFEMPNNEEPYREVVPMHFIGRHEGVRFEIWSITPELAARMLERVHNRPRRVPRVAKYSRVMRRGGWRLNYEWIGIDEEGYIIEGQHRLQACIEADVPFVALVLIGVPRALFPSLGTPLPRGGADITALRGIANYTQVAAALVYVYRAERGMPLYTSGIGSRPENDEVMELLDRHPKITDSVSAARRCARIFPSVGMLTYLHYEFSKRDPVLADKFIEKLASGLNMSEGDPVHVLRETLRNDQKSTRKMSHKYLLAITIKAWNYARAGRRAPKFLRWSEGANESFPTIK